MYILRFVETIHPEKDSFAHTPTSQRRQSGRVCRVDAGGDVLIDFHGDLREQWAARPEDLRWTTGDGAD